MARSLLLSDRKKGEGKSSRKTEKRSQREEYTLRTAELVKGQLCSVTRTFLERKLSLKEPKGAHHRRIGGRGDYLSNIEEQTKGKYGDYDAWPRWPEKWGEEEDANCRWIKSLGKGVEHTRERHFACGPRHTGQKRKRSKGSLVKELKKALRRGVSTSLLTRAQKRGKVKKAGYLYASRKRGGGEEVA